MKTKLLIVILTVIILLVFFLPKKGEKTYIKSLSSISSEIDSFVIKKGNVSAYIFQENDEWKVAKEKGSESYKADKSKVQEILKNIKEEKKVEVVSKSKAYYKYELDEENRIDIKAYYKEKEVAYLSIGKSANNYSSYYTLLKNDSNIYQLVGQIRDTFFYEVKELRDKKVYSFNAEDILSLKIDKGVKSVTLMKKNVNKNINQKAISKVKEVQEKKGDLKEIDLMWKDEANKEYKKYEIDDIVNTISNLKVDKFLEESSKEFTKGAFYIKFKIELKQGKSYQLTLFKRNETFVAVVPFMKQAFSISSEDIDRLDIKWQDIQRR